MYRERIGSEKVCLLSSIFCGVCGSLGDAPTRKVVDASEIGVKLRPLMMADKIVLSGVKWTSFQHPG